MAYTRRGESRGRHSSSWVISLSFRALQEDGVKELIVWLLVEAKGMNTDDEFEEGSR